LDGKSREGGVPQIVQEVVESWPNYLGVYTARLAALETQRKDPLVTAAPELTAGIDEEMKSLIEKIISLTDKSALLAHFGSKNADPKQKTQMERMRNAYVDALVKRATIFGEDVENCWTEVCTFFEPGDNRVVDLTVKDAIARGQLGRAAKLLLKSEESTEKEKKLLEIYGSLVWKHAVWLLTENLNFKAAMKDYRPF